MEPLTRELRRSAIELFANRLDAIAAEQPVDGLPLPYDVCPLIEQVAWRIPMLDQMVRGELQELTNSLNQWKGAIRRWQAWVRVLEEYAEDEAWALQWEFVEPLAFQCMYQPSSARDRFVFAATNAFHQARLATDRVYVDRLEEDPAVAKRKPKHPSRSNKEAQLRRITEPWQGSKDLLASIAAIDGNRYRSVTANFRNLASHAIAPRFNIGITRFVVRQIVARASLVPAGDGRFISAEVPDAVSVSYGFGGTAPLAMSAVLLENAAEFDLAKRCFGRYVKVLDEALLDLPSRKT
jgi:hypothetical protein